MFIIPSSTAQILDNFFPGAVEPSLKVISHELFYNTPKVRFRQFMLLNYVITCLHPPPRQLYESLVQIDNHCYSIRTLSTTVYNLSIVDLPNLFKSLPLILLCPNSPQERSPRTRV